MSVVCRIADQNGKQHSEIQVEDNLCKNIYLTEKVMPFSMRRISAELETLCKQNTGGIKCGVAIYQ